MLLSNHYFVENNIFFLYKRVKYNKIAYFFYFPSICVLCFIRNASFANT